MKIKFLQNNYKFSPIDQSDYYYQFDFPKFSLKNNIKYNIIPVVGKLPNELPSPKTALDYDVWAITWGVPRTDQELDNLTNPDANSTKAIVGVLPIPRGGRLGTNSHGIRKPSETGYTFGANGGNITEWNSFKTKLQKIPLGRRAIDVVYWYSDIENYTPESFNYYKATADGTTYEGTKFLTPWKPQNAADASSSFDAFLNLAHREGVSFDFITSDFENWDTWNIDGAYSYTWYPNTFGSDNITGDARTFSAWLADSRFTDYVFPQTQKTFSEMFYEKYTELLTKDPLLPDVFDPTNLFYWGDNAYNGNLGEEYTYAGVTGYFSFIVDQLNVAAPEEAYTLFALNSGKLYYATHETPSYFWSVSYPTNAIGNRILVTPSKFGSQPFKLMGQEIIGVQKLLIGYGNGILINRNNEVVVWGTDTGLGGTDSQGNFYGISPNGDSLKGVPVQLNGITLYAKDVAASIDTICAVKSDNTVVCWDNTGTITSNVLNGATASSIIGGYSHFAAILGGNHGITCWGNNDEGQCNVPAGITAVQVATGTNHTCGLKADGTVVCWGGELTDLGQTTVPAGLTGVKQLICGDNNTRALRTNGSMCCWGANTNWLLGSSADATQITTPSTATGQYVKHLGITMTNIDEVFPNYWTDKNGNYVAVQLQNPPPQNALQILSPYIGITFAGVTGHINPAEMWTPYGCVNPTCGCGPLGSRDVRKQYYPNVTDYPFSLYSMFNILAPAWMQTMGELLYNNYHKSIYYDNLKKPEYTNFANVKIILYDFPPTNAEETRFRQDSNGRHVVHPVVSWANGASTYYFHTAPNMVFPAWTTLLGRPSAKARFEELFAERSGYVRQPQTELETYNFYAYIDVNQGTTCSDTFGRLVRYPLTDVYEDESDTMPNFYKFSAEYKYKHFVFFMKDLRHSHRSNTSLWQNYSPWIWGWSSSFSKHPDDEDTYISNPYWIAANNIRVAYWYEFNFHLLLHGVKTFMQFNDGTVSPEPELQRILDQWRILSGNSQARPCTNSTADINQPVDRLIMHEAFDRYVISGGKSLKTGEYIWRITVPVHLFDESGLLTLNRVGINEDFPLSVTLNRNAANPENRTGFWLRSKTAVMPEYTISS